MSMQQDKPNLGDQIQMSKANFYQANGQQIKTFENLVELMAQDIIQKNQMIQKMQEKIKEYEEAEKNCTCKEVSNELQDK